MFIQITTYVQDAISRLLTEYKSAANFTKIISVIVNQIQLIENALVDMNIKRYLNAATGQQLDNIGKIVGFPRPPGMSDDMYRLELYGQIKINISQGQPEQIIQVFLLFTQTSFVILIEDFPGEVWLDTSWVPPDQPTLNTTLRIVNEAAPAGVRVAGLVVSDPDDPFAYDGTLLGFGYGVTSDLSIGGKYGVTMTAIYPFAYAGNSSDLGYGATADPIIGGSYAT